jgi:choline dehydrogenase-like flavoprotein
MFIDARQPSNGAVVEADIVIIGAGAAGISLARELIGSGLAVCLLEGGGMEFAWPSQSLYSGLNVGLPYYALDICQLGYLGGGTNAWGGWCRPLDSIDFESRPSSAIRAANANHRCARAALGESSETTLSVWDASLCAVISDATLRMGRYSEFPRSE